MTSLPIETVHRGWMPETCPRITLISTNDSQRIDFGQIREMGIALRLSVAALGTWATPFSVSGRFRLDAFSTWQGREELGERHAEHAHTLSVVIVTLSYKR